MIERYARKIMTEVWSLDNKYNIWFEVEASICEALANLGKIPAQSAKNIRVKGQNCKFDTKEIAKIEAVTKHDVIAFLTYLARFIGEDARYLHEGLTSSDLLDTSFNIQLMQSCDILLQDIDNLLQALQNLAQKHKYTPTIGRSHGIHAEPTSFGLKIAGFYSEFLRNRDRLIEAKKEISVCAISGAVGNFANIDPKIEEYIAQKFQMAVEPISTQVIPRDRHAMFFNILAIVASSIERIAIEIRSLQRTEISEVEEFFSQGQKGSSAMPHKRNPVLSENLTGLARIIRSYALPAMENVALWHERDISHSSVERFSAQDACVTLDFALDRLTNIITNLVIYPEQMLENIDKTQGLIYSQRILLALIEKGLSREQAYELVQENAHKIWRKNICFKDQLLSDERITKYLNKKEIDQLFDLTYYLKYVDVIFDRVFQK